MSRPETGWVYLHKSILKWEWYEDINVFRIFTHLLLKANYTTTKWRGIEIKRGQHLTGRFSLSKETGLTEQQVRTALDKLISTNEITKETTNQYTIITITNYDTYQPSNQQPNQRITNEQPTDNHSLNKRIKRNKINKNTRDSYLKILRDPEFWEELSLKFNTNRSYIEQECEKMEDWLKAKGKRQSDYKAFARNWIRRATESQRKEYETGRVEIDRGLQSTQELIKQYNK